jgi:hypothetical protein
VLDLGQPENLDEALRLLVRACGGAENAGKRLRPTYDDRAQWVRNCVNPEHPQFFHPEHVFGLMAMAEERGWHVFKHFTDQLTHYQPSVPLSREGQVAAAIAEAQSAQRLMDEKLRALQEVADLSPSALAIMQKSGIKIP